MQNNTQDTVQTVQGTNEVQVSADTTTTVATKAIKTNAENTTSAIEVTGIAMVAIFVFMFVFFLVIKAIDKFFPFKKEE
jgi:hypothetical protein